LNVVTPLLQSKFEDFKTHFKFNYNNRVRVKSTSPAAARKKALPKSISQIQEKIKRNRAKSASAIYEDEEINSEIGHSTLVPEKALSKESYLDFLRDTENAAPRARAKTLAWKPQRDDDDLDGSENLDSRQDMRDDDELTPKIAAKTASATDDKVDFFSALKITSDMAPPSPKKMYRLPRTVSMMMELQAKAAAEGTPSAASSSASAPTPVASSTSSAAPVAVVKEDPLETSEPPKERTQRASFVPAFKRRSVRKSVTDEGKPKKFDDNDRQESDAALEFLKRAEFFAALDRVERETTRADAAPSPTTPSSTSTSNPSALASRGGPEGVSATAESARRNTVDDEIELLEQFIREYEGPSAAQDD